ncbi:MAG: PVC-type heme-binding CxxCH protein, partial [Verrucomicrobiales bacterium]
VALVRKGAEIVVYLDGREEVRGQLEPTHEGASDMFFGGRSDNFANLEGRLDELAFYDRALEGGEIRRLYAASAPMESPPSSPQQTLEQSHVRDGYMVELVAAEPLVVDPVAIDWGEDGSVWVAEMADYPYGLHGGGRVARLLDTDGDGQLDKREDFLAGLSFPAGVMAWGKGVIIAAAPDILYAEDRDGDGVADFTEKWFSGFMEGNQQLRVNGLRLGLDGWIYCASGGHHAGFGTQTVVTAHRTGKKVSLGSRDFRFRPDGRIEPESGPSQFGRVRDDFGNWFGVQNAHPLWHYVLPDRYLRRNPDAPAPDPRNQLRDHMPRLFPAKATQKRFHGFDHVGRYTSACGISIYRDELLFPRVSGRTIAFTCAPFHNVVQRHVLLPDGVGFAGERADDGELDFFASRDRWCRPVMSRTAPDGSLWIVDMYRYMIEHPDWLPPEGKDELRPHYRAGEDRGRIYRVYPTGKRPEPFRGLREGMLAGRNGIVTDLVLRSAGEWGFSERTAAGRAAELVAGAKPIAGLSDPDPGVRSLAIRMLEGEEPPPAEVFRLVDDPAGQVRLQLAFSLGEWGTPEATQCLIELALAGGGDPFLRAAIMSSAIPHFQPLLEGLLENDTADPELLSGLIAMASDEIAIPLLSDVSDPSNAQLRNAARWLLRHPEEQETFQALLASASEIYADEASPIERRAAALPLLITRDQRVAEGVFVNPELARVAIIAGCERGLGAELVVRWRRFSPEMRSLLINHCLNSLANVQALTAELGKSIQPQEFTAAQRQRLLEFKDTKIQARAKQVFGERVSDRASLVESYQPSLRIDGDPEKGRHHFRAACAVCHRLENHGGEVGPDLTAITNRTKPALLTAILDPNRNVDPRHLGYAALGSETTLAAGMISAETATSVIFRLLDGRTKPVARKDIVTLENLGRSFMPEGFEANLDQQAMADLLAYLDRQLSTEASTSD